MILAGDIMAEEIVTVDVGMFIRQVAHMMLRKRVSACPVINKSGDMIGIITMTDLFMLINKAFIKKTDEEFDKRLAMFRDMTVGDVMSSQVIAITPATTLEEIVNLVVRKKMHAFPVMRERKIVGIVGRDDILNAVFSYD